MNFDALDFFQTQKLQEKHAIRLYEDAKAQLDKARNALEQSELALMEKKKFSGDLRKRLAHSLQQGSYVEQVDLVQKTIDLAVQSMEKQILAKVELIQERVLGNENFADQEIESAKSHFQSCFAEVQHIADSAGHVLNAGNAGNAQIQELEAKLTSLNAECAEWEFKLAAIQKEHEKLKKENQELSASLTDLDEQICQAQVTKQAAWNKRVEDAQKLLAETLTMEKVEYSRILAEQESANQKSMEILADKQQDFSQAQVEYTHAQTALVQACEQNALFEQKFVNGDCVKDLVQMLAAEREKVLQLRQSTKSVDVMVDERRKHVEGEFVQVCIKQIDPQRERLSQQKRVRQGKLDAKDKLCERFSQMLGKLDTDLAQIQRQQQELLGVCT